MGKIPMTQEDREYFKSGARTLCGVEVLQVRDMINHPDAKKDIYRRGFGLYEQRVRQTGRGGICPDSQGN